VAWQLLLVLVSISFVEPVVVSHLMITLWLRRRERYFSARNYFFGNVLLSSFPISNSPIG